MKKILIFQIASFLLLSLTCDNKKHESDRQWQDEFKEYLETKQSISIDKSSIHNVEMGVKKNILDTLGEGLIFAFQKSQIKHLLDSLGYNSDSFQISFSDLSAKMNLKINDTLYHIFAISNNNFNVIFSKNSETKYYKIDINGNATMDNNIINDTLTYYNVFNNRPPARYHWAIIDSATISLLNDSSYTFYIHFAYVDSNIKKYITNSESLQFIDSNLSKLTTVVTYSNLSTSMFRDADVLCPIQCPR